MSKPVPAAPAGRPVRRRASPVWSVLALLVALPVAGFSMFRAIPVEWPLIVVQLVSFTPWLVVPAAVAFVLALTGRRPFPAIATAALLAVQLFWLFPLDYGRPAALRADAPPPVPVKVMTLNAEFGEADAGDIVRLVRENDVDVLTIQEHTQGLEDRLGAAGLSGILPELLSDPNDDASGSALYSKFPLEAVGQLPDTPFRMPVVRVAVGSSSAKAVLTVTSIHALPPVDERIEQWRSDLAAIGLQASRPGHQLLMGDYNATYDHAEFRQLLDGGTDGGKLVDVGVASGGRLQPTWPMEGPALPGIVIDHVVTSPLVGSTGYSVHRVPGTDHAAIVATLTVPVS
ncbi:endonuclease/exonuclease/phosphatase family protein [Paenarthrobacter sp. NPDC089322]|uniref:endonuclease/exonuclease/phosphatase family protein n=1 Tax=Paenarthrobacter sp. NPDC089322 TaxID=3155065 RepID=UPI0034433746